MALDGGRVRKAPSGIRPTEAGKAAHTTWLPTPIEPSTVSRDLGLHLMRFVMMERAVSRDGVLGFLDNLSIALAAFTASLSDAQFHRLAIATRALP